MAAALLDVGAAPVKAKARCASAGTTPPPSATPLRAAARAAAAGSDAEGAAEQARLGPLVLALAPRASFVAAATDDGGNGGGGRSGVPFITYDDGVLDRAVVAEAESELTGAMVVEDVELRAHEAACCSRGAAAIGCAAPSVFRRRLRFRRMPDLVQSEVALRRPPLADAGRPLRDRRREIDPSRLVHKYLPAVMAGFVLVAPLLEAAAASGTPPRLLVLGGGAGALPAFVHRHFPSFHIQVVELDKVVVRLARRHFGLHEGSRLRLQIADARHFVASLVDASSAEAGGHQTRNVSGGKKSRRAHTNGHAVAPGTGRQQGMNEALHPFCSLPFHIIVLDIDAGDAHGKYGAPPEDMLSVDFLQALRAVLHPEGMLAVNVVPHSEPARIEAQERLRDVFGSVFEARVDDDINSVVYTTPICIASPRANDDLGGSFRRQLEALLPGQLIESIRPSVTVQLSVNDARKCPALSENARSLLGQVALRQTASAPAVMLAFVTAYHKSELL
eukprot:SM000028S10114  [mRNA]  locus=s28:442203:444567:- [translate_table: standard]